MADFSRSSSPEGMTPSASGMVCMTGGVPWEEARFASGHVGAFEPLTI